MSLALHNPVILKELIAGQQHQTSLFVVSEPAVRGLYLIIFY